jgi:hypothetical protein
MKRRSAVSHFLCTVTLASACAAPVDDPSSAVAVAPQQTLAELEVGNSQLRFERLQGDQLAVIEDRPIGEPSVLADPELQPLNVVDTYERLAGRPAPALLVDAFHRSLEAAAELDAIDPEPEEASAEPAVVAASSAALTAADFQSQYCGELAHTHCLVNQSIDQTLSMRAFLLGANVNADRGDVTVDLRLDRWIGGWETRGTWTVYHGRTMYFSLKWNGTARRNMAIRFRDTQGDNYHVSAWFWN